MNPVEQIRLSEKPWPDSFLLEMFRCFYCERPFGVTLPGEKLPLVVTRDHIIPICKGGGNERSNKVVCCSQCNSIKGRMDLRELYEFLAVKINKLRKDNKYNGLTKEELHIFAINVTVLLLNDNKNVNGDLHNRIFNCRKRLRTLARLKIKS